jgi:branched-chain amino acid aminotransferase
LGVRPAKEALYFVILSPVGHYYAEGAKALRILVEDKSVRAAPGGLGDIKAGANYAASLKSAHEAKSRGFAQVLWLDVEHEGIEEVGTMNVFFVFKDHVATPELNGSILAGNIRDAALKLLRSWNQDVRERRITMDEVIKAFERGDLLEIFGTGTAAVVSEVGELEFKGRVLTLPTQERRLSARLLQTIESIQHGTAPDPFGWMTPLNALA